jgi:hypothetical protein
MYTASFEDRERIPRYIKYFLENTSQYERINLITSASQKTEENGSGQINIISLGKLDRFTDIVNLFDSIYVHASVNSPKFEKACFLRWLALNSATKHLSGNEWVCMLDTDFILGMSPEKILTIAQSQYGDDDLEFIAEWNFQKDMAIGPEVTFMKKDTLVQFCEFIMIIFFEKATHLKARLIYFDRISRGLGGGISDMTALALFMKQKKLKSFNLLDLNASMLIPNLKIFAQNSAKENNCPKWEITYYDQKLLLTLGQERIPLIGIHCQGGAKNQMANLIGSYGSKYWDRIMAPQKLLSSDNYSTNGGKYLAARPQQYLMKKANKFLTFSPISIQSILAST